MKTRQLFYGLALIALVIFAVPTSAQNLQPNYAVVAWSPNGEFIAEGGQNGLLQLRDATTGQVVTTFQGAWGTVNSIDWSPDSTKIVTEDSDPLVKMWDINTGQLITSLQGHIASVYSVAWSPDGTRIASISLEDTLTLRVWNATTYQSLNVIYAGYTGSVAWNPSSNRLAYVHYGKGTFVIDPSQTISPYDLGQYNISGFNGSSAVTWSPEGSYLAIADVATRNIGIWLIRTEEQLVTLSGHTDEITSLTWSSANNTGLSLTHLPHP